MHHKKKEVNTAAVHWESEGHYKSSDINSGRPTEADTYETSTSAGTYLKKMIG